MTGLRATLVLVLVLAVAAGARAKDDDRVGTLVKQMKDRDDAVRLAAVRDAAKLTDPALTKPLVSATRDPVAIVRQAAIEALRGRQGEESRKTAAQALASHLKPLSEKPALVDEYVLTISVLHDLAQPVSIEALLDMGVDEDPETARARLMAVGNVPAPEAVDGLIKFLAKGKNKGRNNQRDLCHQALRYATGENLGGDPDKWRAWWKKARATFDFEEAAAGRAAAKERERRKREKREERERKQREKKEKGGKKGDGDGS